MSVVCSWAMTVTLCVLCHVAACKCHLVLPKRAWRRIARFGHLQLCLTLELLVMSKQAPLAASYTWYPRTDCAIQVARERLKLKQSRQRCAKHGNFPGHPNRSSAAPLLPCHGKSRCNVDGRLKSTAAINCGDRYENRFSRREWHPKQRPVCCLPCFHETRPPGMWSCIARDSIMSLPKVCLLGTVELSGAQVFPRSLILTAEPSVKLERSPMKVNNKHSLGATCSEEFE